jgi:protein-S-isoprenylcysteine O-methyltransferase Ste14
VSQLTHENNSTTAGVIALPPYIYMTGVLAGAILQIVFPIALFPSWVFQILGIPFILFGVYLAIWAKGCMEKIGTNVNPHQPTLALVNEGPYRFTRNPMYLGMTLGQIGLALLFNSLWILLTLPVVLVVMQVGVILREERYLESLFGEEYRQYKSRVHRWL